MGSWRRASGARSEPRAQARRGDRLIADTLLRSGDIGPSCLGPPQIRDLRAEAGARFAYDGIPFGAKLTFHRNDPFAGPLPDVAGPLPDFAGPLPDFAGSRVRAVPSDGERAVAGLLAAPGTLRTSEAAEALGLPARTARYTLRRLVEKGVAEAHGSTRSRSYSIRVVRGA